MAKINNNEIPDFQTDWGDDGHGLQYSGARVQEFIKKYLVLGNTANQERWGTALFDVTSYSLIGFKDEDNKAKYLETGDKSLIVGAPVPFSFTGTVNQLKIINNMSSGNLYFTAQAKEAIIECSFLSQEKGITDSAWSDVNEDFEVTVSIDKGNTGVFEPLITSQSVLNGNTFTFDVRNAIATGANRVRVSAKGVDTGATGAFTYTVNLTTMYLAPSNFTWYLPFVEGNSYSLGGLNIGGNLQKLLRIKVTKEEAYVKEYEINIGTAIYTSTAYVYDGLEFPTAGTGVYNVEMWLDANGLESEHLSYNIICVSDADKFTKQLVCISDAPKSVYNSAENKLFNYCIYNQGKTSGSPHITIDSIINTNKTNIKSETLANVSTATALEYKEAVEIETEESNVQLSVTMAYGNSQQVVYQVDNSKAFPATKDAVFYLNAAQRSNSQEDRESIVNAINSEKYTATWTKMGWSKDGWTEDDGGRKCLYVPAFSKVDINYQPLADISTPVTLEFVFKVSNASDYDDPIITICNNATSSSFQGIKITPKNICAHTRNLKDSKKQDYNLLDEKVLDIIVTIVPNYKTNYGNLAQIYCNGTKVRSFEFTSLSEWDTKANIVLGNNTADLFLYKLRVYHKGFDKADAMQNYLNSLPSAEREAMYKLLMSVTDDSYSLDYDTCVKNGKNTMVIEMLNGKDIPSLLNQEEDLLCNLQINIHNIIEGELDEEMEELLTGKNITNQVIEGQGTTAMTYGRWNFRWKLDKAYGKRRITAKKNVASSMQSHKMGSTRMFNYLHHECVGANEANANVAVLQYPVYGFQKVLSDDGKSYTYRPIGLYTIGADKGDKHTFGFDNETYAFTLIHMEGSDHTPKSVGFDYPWSHTKFIHETKNNDATIGAIQSDGGVIGAWEVGMAGGYATDEAADESNIQIMLNTEFKPAYDVAYNNSTYLIGTTESVADMNADVDAWQAQKTENGESYAGYEFWNPTDYKVYFYNQATKQYEPNGINLLTDLGIDASEVSSLSIEEATQKFIDARKARFVNEWGNYWHKDDAIFHYVFCLLFGATDNFKKNTYPYKFDSRANGGKWRWRADDLDTIFDINNQGLAAKLYSILVGDKTDTGTGSIYRGDNSAFWTLIKETQQAEIKAMVHKIFDAMTSHPKAEGSNTLERLVGCIRYFYWKFAQEYFPQSAYNVDTEWTYEDIWANKDAWKEVNPLNQALGGHYEAEVDWVTMRMLFCASYYNYGAFTASGYKDATTGQIVYGGASAHTYEITPAIDINPTIIKGSTETITYGDRVKANTTVPLTVSDTSGADTRIYVQGLDWIKDLGDLSSLIVSADNPSLSVASKRLQRLKVGDEDASKMPTSGTIQSLNFGSCPSMMLVDAQNLSTLTGTVNLSLLPRLQEALFGGTSVTVITLPSGAKISRLQLPDTLTELNLSNLKFLTSEGLEYTSLDNVAMFKVENCAQLNPFEMLKSIYSSGGVNLSDIRLIGFVYNGDANDVTMIANMANDLNINGEAHTYYGIDESGNRVDVPVLEGTINIEGCIYEDDAEAIKAAYGETKLILNVSGGFYMKFQDPEVLRVLLTNGVGDGVGVTTEQVKAVTSIGAWFSQNTAIETFDEFEKFTGVTSLIDGSYIGGTDVYQGAFRACSSLSSINLPNSIKRIGLGSFASCVNLVNIYIPNSVTDIRAYAFKNTTKLVTTIPESVTLLGAHSFYNSGLSGNLYLPNLSGTIPREGVFQNTQITSISSLGSITEIGGWHGANMGAFRNCTLLETVVLPNTLTKIGDGPFYGCTALRECNIPSSVTYIGPTAFYNCTSLEIEDLQLPNLTSLGQNAFYGVKIKKISDLGKLTGLPSASNSTQNFGDKSVLEEVTLPKTLTDIPSYSFYNYASLKRCNIPEGVMNISVSAFHYCPLEGELYLPNLTGLGAYAFHGTKLSKIVSLGTIEATPEGNANYNVFGSCTNLTEARLPATLTKLGSYTFRNSTALQTIICEATTPPAMGVNPFLGINSTFIIYVPDASVEAYKNASGWSAYADRIKPLSEYDVRILTYNEDGNGGYKLYQVANYDTAKNELVMGVAVKNSEHGFVIAKQSTAAAAFGWSTTQYSDMTTYDGRGNTEAMLTNGTTSGIAHKANDYIFSNGTNGYIGSYAECLIIYNHRDVINEALTKVGGNAISGEHYTSTSYDNNAAYARVLKDAGMGGQDKSVARPCRPQTELPNGVTW